MEKSSYMASDEASDVLQSLVLGCFSLPAGVFHTEYKLRSSIGINVPYTILIWRYDAIKKKYSDNDGNHKNQVVP